MTAATAIKETPWDKRAFGIDTYEIVEPTEDVLKQAMQMEGHFTVKIDPLANAEPLHRHGFYYCGTLIEPYCQKEWFRSYPDENVFLVRRVDDFEALKEISDGSFVHGRYHRDFQLERSVADKRYANWLHQMYKKNNIFSLYYKDELAGFFGFEDQHILLYTHRAELRGKGLAKCLWTAACEELFAYGHRELISSISAANLPILNLKVSLGFKFRNARDVYHKLNRPGDASARGQF